MWMCPTKKKKLIPFDFRSLFSNEVSWEFSTNPLLNTCTIVRNYGYNYNNRNDEQAIFIWKGIFPSSAKCLLAESPTSLQYRKITGRTDKWRYSNLNTYSKSLPPIQKKKKTPKTADFFHSLRITSKVAEKGNILVEKLGPSLICHLCYFYVSQVKEKMEHPF